MPLYEYQCKPNKHRFEARHGMNEEPVQVCPVCGGEVRRIIHPVGIVFKGSGFYATDSRGSSSASKPAEKQEGGSTKPDKPKSDSVGTDSPASGEPAKAS